MISHDKSVRFLPHWNRHQPNQVIGLLNLICEVLKENPGAYRVLEIGSYMGESATLFAGFPQFKEISLVDGWGESADTLRHRFEQLISRRRIAVYQMPAHEFIRLPGFYDLIYIDAGHDYKNISQDIAFFHGRVDHGGHLAGHDYIPHFPGVMQAVDEFAAKVGVKPRTFIDGSWLIARGEAW